jgi:spermidine synthase
MTTALFGTTAFLSALLLFLVEPLIGRMVLPRLGGSAAVWTTCLVVFQSLLFLAYAWSHLMARFPARLQPWLHVGILFLGLTTLPLSLPGDFAPPEISSPQARLIVLLLSSVGLSFFALATNAPTLQRWFTASGQEGRNDPYFLYGFSNAGSLIGLLLYPLILEPFFTVTQHRWIWSAGYVVLLAMMAGCGLGRARILRAVGSPEASPATPKPGWALIGRWVCLSLVPSSLTVGCTAYLSTELAPVPLLWVVPLALYLVTFVLSFTGRVVRKDSRVVQLAALIGLAVATAHITGRASNATGLLLHLSALFMICALCHGRLADSRPAPDHLTGFYLWISVGGIIGGLFNALVAPTVLHTALEYPLMLIMAPLALAAAGEPLLWTAGGLSRLLPIAAAIMWVGSASVPHPSVALLVPFGALAIGIFRRRTMQMVACTVAALLFLRLSYGTRDEQVVVDRSFYSVLRVADNYEPGYRALIHGTTVHGMQAYDPSVARKAVTYYAAEGPVGQMFSTMAPRLRSAHVGIVGLGAGEMAVYARPGQEWTFFEIDPLVEHMARHYFTYLGDAAVTPRVTIGDGRRSLTQTPPKSLDLLVLDAFASDAIPVHLLTQEAFALYQGRLRGDGVLAVHISNRFVDLAPLLAGTAHAAGLCGFDQSDAGLSGESTPIRRRPSRWIVLAASCDTLSELATDKRWNRLTADSGSTVWSDERADLLTVVLWSSVLGLTSR